MSISKQLRDHAATLLIALPHEFKNYSQVKEWVTVSKPLMLPNLESLIVLSKHAQHLGLAPEKLQAFALQQFPRLDPHQLATFKNLYQQDQQPATHFRCQILSVERSAGQSLVFARVRFADESREKQLDLTLEQLSELRGYVRKARQFL